MEHGGPNWKVVIDSDSEMVRYWTLCAAFVFAARYAADNPELVVRIVSIHNENIQAEWQGGILQ